MNEKEIPILYQDNEIIIVHKPCGLLVHPYWKETNERDNLMNRVRDQIGLKVYPIHRLDRPVSGVIMFGLNGEIVKRIQEHWHDKKKVHKEYIALVHGEITEAGKYDFPLSDQNKVKKDALTNFIPLTTNGQVTLMQVMIETGRQHQIRRHFARSKHNLIGDVKHGRGAINRHYRDEYKFQRIFLHSYRFKIDLDFLKVDVICPLPDELTHLLDQIGISNDTIPDWRESESN
ncbi:hypothetical protein A9Q84_07860 [Halobacteriovorax marinus]|uniref:tRNA pseudouridine synthase C n=1 Tax=Halobacteriovorax marinus TaxID=97084 RepID=A0A1Y5F649_9BACT|nr:hypothetical protein A9Q84_07860 [Halobacteriovorax marinus]